MSLRRLQILPAWPVGWILYTLMMGVISLALTFPFDPLHAMFLARLSERSGMDIHTERWDLQWPAGIVWSHPSIELAGVQRIDAEQIQVAVNLGSVLRGQPVFVWSGHVGGRDRSNGTIKGELSLAAWSWSGPAQILGSVEHLDLSELSLPLAKKGFFAEPVRASLVGFIRRTVLAGGSDVAYRTERLGVGRAADRSTLHVVSYSHITQRAP